MLPAPVHIVSDLHLGAAPPHVEPSFLSFLDRVGGERGSLVINGDLFDFWFEWKTVIPRVGFRSLAALARLREAGIPILWLAGNHDCWGGSVLRDEVGVDFRDEWRGNLGGWESWLHHGDGLRESEDRRYRRLRRVLRSPWSVRAFRWLHPDVGSRIATGSSEASRVHRAHDEGSGLRSAAFDRLAADPLLRLVVFGHSHVAALERAPAGGVYANAGSWLDAPTYLRVDPERVQLLRVADGSAEDERLHSVYRAAEEVLPER